MVNGTIPYDAGADGPKTLGFAPVHNTNVKTTGNVNVTSNDLQVKYYWDSGTNTVYGTTNTSSLANAITNAVFKVQITNVATGAFTFTLLGNVDHPTPNTEDNLNINLSFTITDGDDDPVSGNIVVNIDDDMCVVADCNILVNGSFELGNTLALTNDWDNFATITGWSQGADGIPFEVQKGNVGDVLPQDGNIKIELDADTVGNPDNPSPVGDINPFSSTNATIQQTVNTVAGDIYELTFYYSPRPSDGNANSSSMQVLWNGAPVHIIDSTVQPDGWQQITVLVTGTGGPNTLGFQGLGQQNELGAYIDNVELCRLGVVDEDGLLHPLLRRRRRHPDRRRARQCHRHHRQPRHFLGRGQRRQRRWRKPGRRGVGEPQCRRPLRHLHQQHGRSGRRGRAAQVAWRRDHLAALREQHQAARCRDA